MSSVVAPVAALLLSVAILLTGNGLQGTLLPVRAELEAFGTFSIGVLGSAYFVGFAIGCVFGPQTVRRVGHIRTFTALTAVASAVALAHALIVQPQLWWLLRAITGFCFAGLYVVIESWLNDRATNETRGTILSLYTVINLTVITLGQLMITFYDPSKFPLFALASILVSLAAVPVAITTSQAPVPPKLAVIRPQRLYRVSPVGLMGCFASGLANGPFWTLGPLFAVESGLDLRGVAFFMSLTVLGGAIGQWPLGLLSDRMDRRKVIVGICAVAAVGAVALAVMSRMAPAYILWGGLGFGLFAFPLYAVCVAHANDYVDPAEFVEASGSLLLVNAAGSIVGPLVAAVAMGVAGPAGLFGTITLVFVIMAGFALYRMRQRAGRPAAEKAHFVAVPRTSPEVAPLDPRAATELRAQAEAAEAARTGVGAGPEADDTALPPRS